MKCKWLKRKKNTKLPPKIVAMKWIERKNGQTNYMIINISRSILRLKAMQKTKNKKKSKKKKTVWKRNILYENCTHYWCFYLPWNCKKSLNGVIYLFMGSWICIKYYRFFFVLNNFIMFIFHIIFKIRNGNSFGIVFILFRWTF